MKSLICIALLFVLTTKDTHGAGFAQQPRQLEVNPGQRFQMNCKTDLDYTVCFWQFKNTSYFPDVNTDIKPVAPNSKRDCSFYVEKADARKHNGEWRCSVLFPNRATAMKSRAAKLIVRKAPRGPPQFSGFDPSTQIQSGEKKTITCEIRGARPAADIHWYIGKRRIDSSNARSSKKLDNHREDTYKTVSNLTRPFEYRDNDQPLRCVVKHSAIPDKKLEAQIPIHVVYSPQISQLYHDTFYGLQEGKQQKVFINITSNPRPYRWELNIGNDITLTMRAPFSMKDNRYMAELRQKPDQRSRSDEYQVVLTITKVKKMDIEKEYSLLVANSKGEKTYDFYISMDPQPARGAQGQEIPQSSRTSEGLLSQAAIIGIIIAVIVLIILIIFIVVARKKGMLCFAAGDGPSKQSGSEQKIDAENPPPYEGSDNPAINHAQTEDEKEQINGKTETESPEKIENAKEKEAGSPV